jgi:hypothetical protein
MTSIVDQAFYNRRIREPFYYKFKQFKRSIKHICLVNLNLKEENYDRLFIVRNLSEFKKKRNQNTKYL